MVDITVQIRPGLTVTVPQGTTAREIEEAVLQGGFMTAEELFPRPDPRQAGLDAQAATFAELNPAEQFLVGAGKELTNIAAAGNISAGEREAQAAITGAPAFIGELIPETVAQIGRRTLPGIALSAVLGATRAGGGAVDRGIGAALGGAGAAAGEVVGKAVVGGARNIAGRVARAGDKLELRARELDATLTPDPVARSLTPEDLVTRQNELVELTAGAQELADPITNLSPAAQRIADANRMEQLGFTLTPGQVTGNRGRLKLEASMRSTPIVSQPLDDIATANSETYSRLALSALGETGDVLDGRVLGRANTRLSEEFTEIAGELGEDVFAESSVANQFTSRIGRIAQKELRDIQVSGLTEAAEDLPDLGALQATPILQRMKRAIDEGIPISGAQLMAWRSSLADKAMTLGRQQASGNQIALVSEAIDAIDEAVALTAGGDTAARYLVARSQWRILNSLERVRVNNPTLSINARGVDNILRNDYKGDYLRSGLEGFDKARTPELQALADFFDATKGGATIMGDIVGNSGTAERMAINTALNQPQGLPAFLLRGNIGKVVGEEFIQTRGITAPGRDIPLLEGIFRATQRGARAPGAAITLEELRERE